MKHSKPEKKVAQNMLHTARAQFIDSENITDRDIKDLYWRRWYIWLILFLLGQILLFSFFTQVFK